MQLLVVVGADVAARENFLKVTEEIDVDRHHVLEVAVLRAILHHQDLPVALDDRRLNFADRLVQQNFIRQLAVENVLADLRHALRTKRVRRAGPAQRRLRLLVRLEQWLVAPLRRERLVLVDAVQLVEHYPRASRAVGEGLLNVLDWLMHEPLFSSPKNEAIQKLTPA